MPEPIAIMIQQRALPDIEIGLLSSKRVNTETLARTSRRPSPDIFRYSPMETLGDQSEFVKEMLDIDNNYVPTPSRKEIAVQRF